MREIPCAVVDLDHYLEEAARAKHALDADHWRDELRRRAIRLFRAEHNPKRSRNSDHHAPDSSARLGPVKALRFASTPPRRRGLRP